MFKLWIYILITFCYISGIYSDIEHVNEIRQYLKNENCLKQQNYILENVVSDYDRCIVHAIGQLWEGYEKPDGGATLSKLLCSEGVLTQCMQQADGKLANCYTEASKKEAFVRALESTNEAVAFLCYDNQEELKRFVSGESQRCVETQMTQINKDCNQDANNINDLWFQRSFTQDHHCKDRGQWSSCVLDLLDDCEDKTAYDVVQKTLKSALTYSPCYIKIQHTYPHVFSHSTNVLTNHFVVVISIVFTIVAQFFT